MNYTQTVQEMKSCGSSVCPGPPTRLLAVPVQTESDFDWVPEVVFDWPYRSTTGGRRYSLENGTIRRQQYDFRSRRLLMRRSDNTGIESHVVENFYALLGAHLSVD
jgi:hypothetical protein